MAPFSTLTVETDQKVARVRLNRPDKANCLNEAMWQELKMAFAELDQARNVRVVVLDGAGDHFSTGIDLAYLASVQQDLAPLPSEHRPERVLAIIRGLQDSVMAIEHCRKPVLAAIQGNCLGAGVDIVAACDMRYAVESARFSVKEVDLAIVADLGSLQRLPGIVGEGIARDLALTGRMFDGQEALAMGFINQVFRTAADLEAGVMAVAAALVAKSPSTVRGIKEILNFSRDHSVAEGLARVAQRNAAELLSTDLAEAIAALSQKRSPRYDD